MLLTEIPDLDAVLRAHAPELGGDFTGYRHHAYRVVNLCAALRPADGEAARKHALTVAQVEEWRELFLAGAENGLRSRPRDEEGLKDAQIKQLKQKVGELVLDLDVLKEAMRGRPFGPRTSDE